MKITHKKGFLGCMLFFLIVTNLQGRKASHVQVVDDTSFFDKVGQIITDPITFMQSNMQVMHLIRAVMHIPYIVSLDSQDPHTIKTSALLSALATNTKCFYELFREREKTSLAKLLVTDAIKIGGYSLASVYDVIRFLEASNIALHNKQPAFVEKARSMKINQVVFLLLEVLLRAVSQISLRADKAYDHQDNLPARLTAAIADLVEIWRLITRYNAYFSLSKVQADLKFVVQRHECSNIPYELEEDEEEGKLPVSTDDIASEIAGASFIHKQQEQAVEKHESESSEEPSSEKDELLGQVA